MALPAHVRLSRCIPDPGGRANHIYHEPTDEVFNVGPEMFDEVSGRADRAGGSRQFAVDSGEESVLASRSARELREIATDLGEEPAGNTSKADLVALIEGKSTKELRAMLKARGIDAAPNASKAKLIELIEQDKGGSAKPSEKPAPPADDGPTEPELRRMLQDMEIEAPPNASKAELEALVEQAVRGPASTENAAY